MNIAIVGPGAMGLLMAGYLFKTKANLTLVDNVQEHADLLKRKGIRWEGFDSDIRFAVPVTVGLKDPENTDLVILCVKAYDTDAASRDLARTGYRGPMLTLQNGAGNIEILQQNLPDSPIMAGATSEGANLVDEAHVRHAGKGKTEFGPVNAGRPGRNFMEEVAELMRNAGIDAELTAEPQSLVWSKVMVNAGINPLTAILRVQNGKLLEIEPARMLMRDLVLEGWEVFKRMKLRPAYTDPLTQVENVCRLTASNYSSMYQDLAHARRTEIDFINGAIVQEGKRRGVPCLCNESVMRIIHSMELIGKSDGPGKQGF
jgi:2-dehydropantoate 2-reductase